MNKKISVITAILLSISIICVNSATLTVPSPYATVQAALNAAAPGDTILPDAGSYAEQVITMTNGTSSNPITLNGVNGVTLQQIHLRHQYYRIINCTIMGPVDWYENLVYFDHNAHFCVLSNNTVNLNSAINTYGIGWRTPLAQSKPFGTGQVGSDNLIISNTVKNGRAYILMSVMGDRNIIHGNLLTNSPNVDFFRLFGRSNIIRGNICVNSSVLEGLGNHPDFIQTFGNNGDGSYGHIIENNIVSNLEGAQISQLEGNLLPSIGNWTFKNNLFMDIAFQASCTIPDVKYYNNTFIRCNYLNGGHALTFSERVYQSFSTWDGSTGTNYAHNIDIKNNIFVDCGNSLTNRGWYGFSGTLTNLSADYNYVSKFNYNPVKQDVQQRDIGSPGGWDTFGWWEDHGINGGNPSFVNTNTSNYRLLNTSFIKDVGYPFTNIVTVDFDGISRPQGSGWSIGAFEPVLGSHYSRRIRIVQFQFINP